MELMVTIQADMSDPFVHPDPGSRLWLISNALDTSTELPDRTSNQKTITAPTFDIPSHPHHSPNDDDEELPEDRFHRKDASSSYILQQREEGLSKAKSKRDAAAVSDKVILNDDEDDENNDKLSENDILRYSISLNTMFYRTY